jgi:hypothetical protein
MDDNIVHLNVWGGDWDLPSVDPNCLAALVNIIKLLHDSFVDQLKQSLLNPPV